jgi:hypothetical protein
MPSDLETRLRRGLRATADDVAPAPHDLADRVRQRARRQQRTRLGVAAAGLAAALVVVGVPVAASVVLSDRTGGHTADGTVSTLVDLPTRGSLSGDAEWLAGVRSLSWAPGDAAQLPAPGYPDPPVGERRVAYAGDVPGARVALVLGVGAEPVHAWFTGPVGAAVDQMVLAAPPTRTTEGHPLALMDAPDPAADGPTFVVVAWPGDDARLLTGRTVDADGTTTEHSERVPLTNGAGAIAAPGPATWPLEVQLWVDRNSGVAGSYNPQTTIADRALDVARPLPDVADPRGLRGVIRDQDLRSAVETLSGYYGTPADELRLTLLAAGPVREGSPSSVALLGATFPSGATTVAHVVVWPGEDGVSSQVGLTEVAPAGTALLDRVLAVPSSVPGAIALTVSGPDTATVAEVVGADGTPIGRLSLTDGAGSTTVDTPLDGVTVRLFDASGQFVADGPLTDPVR